MDNHSLWLQRINVCIISSVTVTTALGTITSFQFSPTKPATVSWSPQNNRPKTKKLHKSTTWHTDAKMWETCSSRCFSGTGSHKGGNDDDDDTDLIVNVENSLHSLSDEFWARLYHTICLSNMCCNARRRLEQFQTPKHYFISEQK
jgi:hypothetical protein